MVILLLLRSEKSSSSGGVIIIEDRERLYIAIKEWSYCIIISKKRDRELV